MPIVDAQAGVSVSEDDGGGAEPESDNRSKTTKPSSTTPLAQPSRQSTLKPEVNTNAAKQVKPAPSDGNQSRSASVSSPTESEMKSWVASPPESSAVPSRPPSTGVPSIASGKRRPSESGFSNPFRRRRASEASTKSRGDPNDEPPTRPPSAAGSVGGGFDMRNLLGAPKLSRRNSASSRKSVSSGKSGKGGSIAGESALSKKYGICGKLVGKGGTSVVRLAHKWDRTEEKLYAVKEFRKRRKNESEKEYVKKLTSEFCISSTLHHPNVVETVDLVQDDHQNWCEVMEFCPGGDLYAAIRKGGMSEAEVECCFKQLLVGLGYLHNQGVAHRDIKPENLFFDARGQLKIGDFGASTVYRLPWETTIHKSSGLCGSEPYIAPEQFSHPSSYDARLVDIWACGVVYYCLHFQELPWGVAQMTDNLYSAYAKQCNTPAFSIANIPLVSAQPSSDRAKRAEGEKEKHTTYPTTIQNLSPRACRPILRRMLEPNPEYRILIEDILKHSWIASLEVCTDPNGNPKHIHPSALAAAGGH